MSGQQNNNNITGKMAVDIVLLPSISMTETAIAVNRKLAKESHQKINFDRDNSLPHISLAMGVIDSSDIKKVSNELASIVKEFSVMALQALPGVINQYSCDFTIPAIPDLQKLHERVMDNCKKYFDFNAQLSMFSTPAEVEEPTPMWVNKFLTNSSYQNFRPHITLGTGDLNKLGLEYPIDFEAPTLALCHLGNYCTCRKVLFSQNLENKS